MSPLTEAIKSPIDTAVRLQRQREYFRKWVEGLGEEAGARYRATQAWTVEKNEKRWNQQNAWSDERKQESLSI